MKWMMALALIFATGQTFAADVCPESLTVSFGSFKNVSEKMDDLPDVESTEELKKYANKTFELKKTKGKRVCHYKGLPGLRVKLFNYKDSKRLSLFNSHVQSGVTLNDSFEYSSKKHSLYVIEWAVDEDGCAFGQVSCEPFPYTTGEASFSPFVVE